MVILPDKLQKAFVNTSLLLQIVHINQPNLNSTTIRQ